MNYSVDNKKRKAFTMVKDEALTMEDREFIVKL
jgi:hypothetical protein